MLSQSAFKFMLSTSLRFGSGESEKLKEEIIGHNFSDVAVIIDQGVFNHPQVKLVLEKIKEPAIGLSVYKNESVEPTYDYLEDFRNKIFGNKIDCLVGIGGGSTLDLTKGLAVLLTNDGNAISYRGFPKLRNRPLPVIALPTTAGTASEVTYNAVFTDSKERKKLGINSILNFPICAIIDPLFTVNSPKNVTVSSGADALVHTLESFVHKNHTPISRMYSREAFRLIFNNLGKVLDNPSDIEIRSDLALGAYLAGIALINAGSGPAGAFSYPLGVHYKVPHGYAGAMFISSITKMNIDKGFMDYDQLYDLIEGTDKSLSVKEKNVDFGRKLQELMDILGIPKSLSQYKLKAQDIEFLISQYDILKAAIAQNPIEITRDDARNMLQSLA